MKIRNLKEAADYLGMTKEELVDLVVKESKDNLKIKFQIQAEKNKQVEELESESRFMMAHINYAKIREEYIKFFPKEQSSIIIPR